MIAFIDWVVHHDIAKRLRLLESADCFEPTEYNAVFDGELEKLDQRHDPEVRQQVTALRGFDWGNYLARSLARAGFRGEDLQDGFHAVVVKLLVSPGKLFTGWNPAQHGPLDRRFRASVWNAIRNAQEKSRNRRRWVTLTDPTVMAERTPARHPYSAVLDDFRALVAARLGPLATAILDQRLAGAGTKAVVGRTDLGGPSAYAVKRAVQGIKNLAQRYAARLGGPEFAERVTKAVEAESDTVTKRQHPMAAGRPGQ